jgi:excisionase family DNA binding protein
MNEQTIEVFLPPLATPRQVAEFLQQDIKTVYRRIDDGTFEAHRVGPRDIRVERDSVLKMVSRKATQGQRRVTEKR